MSSPRSSPERARGPNAPNEQNALSRIFESKVAGVPPPPKDSVLEAGCTMRSAALPAPSSELSRLGKQQGRAF
eukprot:12415839-Alexandrium_andersonii.AAC.1